MGRRAIELDSQQVQSFMSNYTAQGLRELHPRIDSIITDTIRMQLPRKLSCSALREVLRGCPVITTAAAAEATGHRYARSTIVEYAMLARIASKAIGDYNTASSRKSQSRAAAAVVQA